jgi:hypothetical protein
MLFTITQYYVKQKILKNSNLKKKFLKLDQKTPLSRKNAKLRIKYLSRVITHKVPDLEIYEEKKLKVKLIVK